MKWALFTLLLSLLALPLRADFEANGKGDYAVEDGIEEIFAECVEAIKNNQIRRSELYHCVNTALKNQEKQQKEETLVEPEAQ